MNVYITRGNRPNKPFLLSVEDKDDVPEGQTWETAHNSDLVTGTHCVCTKEVFDTIAPIVGTLEAPALIADANAQQYAGRINCYIENNSLKIVAQA